MKIVRLVAVLASVSTLVACSGSDTGGDKGSTPTDKSSTSGSSSGGSSSGGSSSGGSSSGGSSSGGSSSGSSSSEQQCSSSSLNGRCTAGPHKGESCCYPPESDDDPPCSSANDCDNVCQYCK